MKKKIVQIILMWLAAALMYMLCSCSVIPVSSKTPAQVVADVCPPIQAALDIVSMPGVVDPAVQLELASTSQVVGFVCSVGDGVQEPDIKDLANNVIPFLVEHASALGVPDEQRQEIVLGLALAKAALSAVIR